MKDLVRGHVTEKVDIHSPDLIITNARPPSPTGLDDHPHPMDLRELHIASRNEDVVYPRGVAEMKVIARVLLETKGGMAWDESQCVGGVGTTCHSIAVADLWRVDEETHPLLDRTWNEAEVHPAEGEVEVSRS